MNSVDYRYHVTEDQRTKLKVVDVMISQSSITYDEPQNTRFSIAHVGSSGTTFAGGSDNNEELFDGLDDWETIMDDLSRTVDVRSITMYGNEHPTRPNELLDIQDSHRHLVRIHNYKHHKFVKLLVITRNIKRVTGSLEVLFDKLPISVSVWDRSKGKNSPCFNDWCSYLRDHCY